jgi:hypothetical protein
MMPSASLALCQQETHHQMWAHGAPEFHFFIKFKMSECGVRDKGSIGSV